jgi:hypothetical protein
MSTNTAHFLIGTSHTYHDGIQPSHHLVLTENSRAGLFLASLPQAGIPENDSNYRHLITWIPTVDTMMKDVLLMIGLRVAKIPELVKLAKESAPGLFLKPRTELYDIDQDALARLHEAAMAASDFPKVVATILEESHLNTQLEVLEQHPCPKEVCVSSGSQNGCSPFSRT